MHRRNKASVYVERCTAAACLVLLLLFYFNTKSLELSSCREIPSTMIRNIYNIAKNSSTSLMSRKSKNVSVSVCVVCVCRVFGRVLFVFLLLLLGVFLGGLGGGGGERGVLRRILQANTMHFGLFTIANSLHRISRKTTDVPAGQLKSSKYSYACVFSLQAKLCKSLSLALALPAPTSFSPSLSSISSLEEGCRKAKLAAVWKENEASAAIPCCITKGN